MMTRRRLLIGTVVGFAGAPITRGWVGAASGETFEVTHTNAEWRKLLTPTSSPCCARVRPSAPSPAHCSMKSVVATSLVRVAISICSPRPRNSRAEPAGRASGRRSRGVLERPRTRASACCEPPFIAAGVAAISVTCSMMVPSRRACAIA